MKYLILLVAIATFVGCQVRDLDLVEVDDRVELKGSILPQDNLENATPVKLVLLPSGHGFAAIQKKDGLYTDMLSWELRLIHSDDGGEDRYVLIVDPLQEDPMIFNAYKSHLLFGNDEMIISLTLVKGDLAGLAEARVAREKTLEEKTAVDEEESVEKWE